MKQYVWIFCFTSYKVFLIQSLVAFGVFSSVYTVWLKPSNASEPSDLSAK